MCCPTSWSAAATSRRRTSSGTARTRGANLADIWRRRDLPRDGKAPVLLQVPGGAWAIGMRRPQAYPLMSHLADRGWVCVSIDYRVSPRHTWPDHIVDVKRALAWIKEQHRRLRRRPGFRCDHRRFGGRASVRRWPR